jgi:hypothetical protein
VATLIDSFAISGRITSADISPDGRSAVLISNTNIYVFKNFTGTNVFNGQYTKLSIGGSWTQKEGVCFNSATSIYIVDEGSSNKFYQVSLSAYLREGFHGEDEEETVEAEKVFPDFSESIYPNPSSAFFNIRNTGEFENAQIIFTDMTGKVISTFNLQPTDAEVRIETEQLQNGIYFVQLVADNERKSSARVIVSH